MSNTQNTKKAQDKTKHDQRQKNDLKKNQKDTQAQSSKTETREPVREPVNDNHPVHQGSSGNFNQNDRLGDNYRSTDMRSSPMMDRLLNSLEQGEDVGHYGHLVFVMVARFFMPEEEIMNLLMKQPDMDETQARAMILQVNERGYNPPRRERILQWQSRQDYKICEDEDDPNGCNVYRELQFPEEIYDNIEDFWEERAEGQE